MEQNIKWRKSGSGMELSQKEREQFLLDFAEQDDNHRGIKAPSPTKSIELYQSECEESGTTTKLHMPSGAKRILENWMYDHRFYCYPSKADKQMLSIKTGLSVQKISNWFINSRRRLLPKMLEREGQDSGNFTITRKKGKARQSISPSIVPMEETIIREEINCEPVDAELIAHDPVSHSDDASGSKQSSFSRGILYDQETDCKCFFVIVN